MASQQLPDASVGVVEIVEPHDRAFFKAHVLDVEPGGKRYLVRYLGEQEISWVECARVRTLPPLRREEEVNSYDPPEGARVEVSFSEEGEYESWWEGEVRKKKGGFYFVSFPEDGTETSEVIERERLRPAYGHTPATFEKRIFPVEMGLQQDMMLTQDSLPNIAKLAELFTLNLSPDAKQLIALGAPKALDTAQALINMHLSRVPQLARVAQKARTLQSQVSDFQTTYEKGTVVSFRVDRDMIGMMIGKQGANIRKAQSLPGIHRIDNTPDGKVNIVADKQEHAEAAREMLEIVHDTVEVREEEVGFVIGKKGSQVQELEAMSNCRIVVDHQKLVQIAGVRSSVLKAKALLQYFLDTLRETREKEKMINDLTGELRNMGMPFGVPNGPVRRDGQARGRGRSTGPPQRGRGGAGGPQMPQNQPPNQPTRGRGGANVAPVNQTGNMQGGRGGAQSAGGRGGAQAANVQGGRGGAQQAVARGGAGSVRGGRGGAQAQPQGPVAQRGTMQVTVSQAPQQARQAQQAPQQAPQQPQQPQQQNAQPLPQRQKKNAKQADKQTAAPAPQQPEAANPQQPNGQKQANNSQPKQQQNGQKAEPKNQKKDNQKDQNPKTVEKQENSKAAPPQKAAEPAKQPPQKQAEAAPKQPQQPQQTGGRGRGAQAGGRGGTAVRGGRGGARGK